MSRAQHVDVLLAGISDSVGDPLSGGKIYTYLAGTTTPEALYATADKTSFATNPIILDSNGRAKVWAEGSYKLVIKTSADVSVDTFDNLIYGVSDEDLIWAGLSTGSSDAYVLSPVPAITEYDNGYHTSFIANHSNSGASTLNISGLGALAIKTGNGADIGSGDIVSGNVITVVYDATAGYFILDTSSVFSTITVSGAGTFGSVVSPILQGAGTIAIKPSGVEKWDFAAGGEFRPTIDNNVDLGTSAYRIKAGYFLTLVSSTLTSPSGVTLTVNSSAGSVLTLGDGSNAWIMNGGTFYPGANNSYDLGGGSWLIRCGYFTKVETASCVSPSGDGFYFGSGSLAQWRVGTDATLYPVATSANMDIGASSHKIKDIYVGGNVILTGIINNGQTYTTGTYTPDRSITHPSSGFLNANYATAKSDIENKIIELYALIATIIDDTLK